MVKQIVPASLQIKVPKALHVCVKLPDINNLSENLKDTVWILHGNI